LSLDASNPAKFALLFSQRDVFIMCSFLSGMIKRISIHILKSHPSPNPLSPMKVSIKIDQDRAGFTLIELLTVIAIITILAVVATPAIQGLQKAGGFTKSVYDLADSLNLARSYAVAQNTYVYVGLTEVDRTQSPAASPQQSGVGRVVFAAVATKDGTSDYSTDLGWDYSPTTGPSPGSGLFLVQVRPPQNFDFLHIATSQFPTGTGSMARPTSSSYSYLPSDTNPLTGFSLPLGTQLDSGKYNFTGNAAMILTFNPQGGILVNNQSYQEVEIDLQPAVSNSAPPTVTDANEGNQAAMVIDGTTGAVTVYRP
jgi:prepilin-type N-terminal cleavage/methylation domain-containing protein